MYWQQEGYFFSGNSPCEEMIIFYPWVVVKIIVNKAIFLIEKSII